MTRALIELDPIDLVLAISSKSLGACESPPNSNKGPYVERVLAGVGLAPGDPWCAAEVYDTGRVALGAKWPLPKTGGCAVLGEFAKAHGVLMDAPERGDVFLLWEHVAGVWRFGHTGFCVAPLGSAWRTHDGNTNGAGSREGWLKAEKERHFKPEDKFIRWVNLL